MNWKLLLLLGTVGFLMPIVGIIYYDNIWLKLVGILIFIFMVIGIIDALTTVIITYDDRLVCKYMFKTRTLYWKDVRYIKYNIQSQGNNIGVHLLRVDEGVVYGKTITISSAFQDYKTIINYAVNKCKDNPFIRIDSEVYNIIK